ncbi:DEAD/DEAH box helicase [Helicobacter hepaticus]|jgi:hypothetical protein|nr:DEAD/DEAH box helicase [Helicobacter hepaticus]
MMTNEQIFDECKRIYTLDDKEKANELFRLLDKIGNKRNYSPVLNHLIREVGIYPYINQDTAIFSDRLVCECFKTDVGENEPKILHREQSRILKRLLEGENLILSAPTSFGKSFIIDALIAIKKPSNILIIVPTISLMDETRRRLTLKFGSDYHIITTSGSQLKDKNIFIFPQERALEYFENLREKSLDLFIVDEFYKMSNKDRRTHILHNIVNKFKNIAKQKYYICPNADDIEDKSKNKIFLAGLKKEILTITTVALNKFDLSKETGSKELKIQNLLKNEIGKSLIYVSTKPNSKKLCKILLKFIKAGNEELNSFSQWLQKHYAREWDFATNIKNGIGQHNSAIHRYIQQLQVKLFSENPSMNIMVSTTSLIEGVNTAARNIIIWNNQVANDSLNSFTYKNIIGRGGRMFKYFVGNIYLLDNENKIEEKEVEKIDINPDEEFLYRNDLENPDLESKKLIEQKLFSLIKDKQKFQKLISYIKNYKIIMNIENVLQIIESVNEIMKSIKHLNNDNPDSWGLLEVKSVRNIFSNNDKKLDRAYKNIKVFAKYNWNGTSALLNNSTININDYFNIEKIIVFDIASFFNDINEIQQILYPDKHINISPFVSKLSNAFLPSVVYTLEEFGLPRMLSKKLHKYNFINFENNDLKIDEALETFKESSVEEIINLFKSHNDFDDFDEYILKYFYDGLGK